MVRRRAIEAKLFKDMAKEYDVPLWMLIKPTNVGLQDITGEEPEEEKDSDEDMDEKSSAEVSEETQTERDDAESDELEDPEG